MALHVGVQDSLIPLGHPGAHAASMRSESWIVVVTLLGSGACGPDVVGEATAGVDESTADDDGADDTQGDDGPESTGDETGAVDDRWQLCDDAAMPEPPEDAGPCAGRVPAGDVDDVQAEAIFGRATHELDHLGDVVQGRALDGGLFERDGDDIWALTDSGYVVGRIAREDSTGRACVRVAFACWTGGHGGFGPSALDGRADVLVDLETVEARGELGLTEGDALTGAPSVDVWVHIEGPNVEGTVGEFAF